MASEAASDSGRLVDGKPIDDADIAWEHPVFKAREGTEASELSLRRLSEGPCPSIERRFGVDCGELVQPQHRNCLEICHGISW